MAKPNLQPRGTKGDMTSSKKPKTIAMGKELFPGVQVNDNYKRGQDKALDSVLDKLKKDPKSLDKSGFSNRWEV